MMASGTRRRLPSRRRAYPTAGLLIAITAVAACTGSPAQNRERRTDTVRVDTDNATWMSLDVRPDGQEIVFDVLGDVFVIPIEGGDARPLLEGPAWENLPRYSPDGSRIAFTSDRSGAQNIWILDRVSGEVHPLTQETEHLPASPTWSPDGDSIAVRRQFTARRTIGAGEIWVYPATGGPGRVLVARQNTQKDINAPSYSADGRFLYYSRNVWPAATFEYNKDPERGIYAIERWSFDANHAETVIRRPGGAVRPTPSPDGRWLAYVTRNGAHSALVLRALASGEERVLKRDLDRDLQSVWATHGVFPAMAWLPDGSGIVLWSGGHLVRVSVRDGRATRIPFHVRQAFEVTPPPEPRFSVASDRFEVKALRWTTLSPDSGTVAFQALGRIWLHELATGESRPLTGARDRFELYPAFSPDGEWVVYATWSDDAGGDLRRTHVRSGETRILTAGPGLYMRSAVSADGTTVAFERATGDLLVHTADDVKPGVYTVPWNGGPVALVTADGGSPSFCADPGRVYFVRERAVPDLPPHTPEWTNYDRLLVSRDLDTGGETVHANAGLATELSLSRDCRQLAWIRYGQVRVQQFDPDGPAFDTDAEPFRQPPGDGGAFLSWTDDGTLFWSLGSSLHAWRPDLPPSGPAARDLGFTAEVAKPDGVLALSGARIVTMGSGGTIEDGLIVVAGDRIRYVGPRDGRRIPEGAAVVDLTGKTVVPGFIDAHWHGLYASHGVTPQANWTLRAGLAFGVTTIFDPFADTHDVFTVAELARAGATLAPRVYSTGTGLYGADAEFSAQVDSVADARWEIRRRKAFGAIAAKSYLLPNRSQQRQVIAAARELGLRVVAEQAMNTAAIMAQVFDGHTSVEHNLPYPVLYDDIVQAWSQTAVDHTPTLTVLLGGLWPSSYWLAQREYRPREALLHWFPDGYLDAKRAQPGSPDLADHDFPRAAEQVRKLHDAGVRVLVGSHAEIIGLGYHWELWMLEGGGMSPGEVLRAATIDGAKHLGLEADLGSLEAGKLADLVVFDADPLEDIHATLTISRVMLGGRLLDVEHLDEAGRGPPEASR
jgi:imidazolonepropionase-like amidohydrolase/Tol biopolymer transport system component